MERMEEIDEERYAAMVGYGSGVGGVWDLHVHKCWVCFELLGFRDFSFRLTLINLLGRGRRHIIVARLDVIFCEM